MTGKTGKKEKKRKERRENKKTKQRRRERRRGRGTDEIAQVIVHGDAVLLARARRGADRVRRRRLLGREHVKSVAAPVLSGRVSSKAP